MVSNAKPETLIRPLVKTAACLGIIQGLLWTVLSLVALIYYYTGVDSFSTYKIGLYLYKIYLERGSDFFGSGFIIGPAEFSYFLYIYLVLSLVWFLVSCTLLWAVVKEKTDKLYEGTLGAWTVDLSILSLLDLILVCLLAHDYHELQRRMTGTGNTADVAMLVVAIGVVMTFAARGFVLWVVNIIFIAILGKHWYQLRNSQGVERSRSAIDGYSTGSRLPPWQTRPTDYEPSEFGNKAFVEDMDVLPRAPPPSQQSQFMEDRYPKNDYKANTRELPQVNLRQPNNNIYGNNDNYWNNRNQNRTGNRPSPRPNTERDSAGPYGGAPTPFRTAKIGRQGDRRSPPLKVSDPYIPDPDYSPPGSPKVRGVLRPKSNYMY